MHPTLFMPQEFECSCCHKSNMDETFVERLILVRRALERPMRLSSAYRCPQHNCQVSGTGPHGPHTTGCAVDVCIYGVDAFRLLDYALIYHFTGIGFSQKGPQASRFVHLDTLVDAPGQPRPWVWSY